MFVYFVALRNVGFAGLFACGLFTSCVVTVCCLLYFVSLVVFRLLY